ncbi:hypothetical protein QO001_005493 [Methylobacterium brachiatum]|jgi:hypothetical protein|uniref:Uncharacterized protein n=1 Tax=Methylobacterium brachiatum TaxID=269660 RepID=A0AAJ1TSW5_9HYPH|nr:hypothetical protein [Methylobacterium brachiatum]MCB4805492.1 hypothetical protein [Methylobacterium brachiatum]MDQ0546541.1 hypothetical protein [Methylobacterium brachiatum]
MPALNEHVAKRPSRGMIVRSKIELSAGTKIYKIGHRTVKGRVLSDDEVLTSPWWISEADFEEISRRACASGSALSEVWRQYGAIARQWGGSCDLVVKAKVVGSLTAFIGPGTIQDMRKDDERVSPSADQPLWVPPPTITQIFIPGLGDKAANGSTSIVTIALGDILVRQV